MKKGKLLAVMNAMAFTVLGTGVAGTFAWYTVNASQNIGVAQSQSLAMVVPNAASGVSAGYVTFGVTWTQDDVYNSEHIHFVDDDGLEHLWQNGTLVTATSAPGTNPYGKMTVQLGAAIAVRNTTNYQLTNYEDLTADQKASIAGRYTMRINGTNSRLHLFAEAPTEHYITGEDTLTISVTIGKTSATPIENNAVSFYYTLDGSNYDEDDGEIPDDEDVRYGFSLTHVSYVPVVA